MQFIELVLIGKLKDKDSTTCPSLLCHICFIALKQSEHFEIKKSATLLFDLF